MNPYEILEIPTYATHAQIKAAYRKAVKKFHPDVAKHNDDGAIKLINQAYEILSDPERRAKYDRGDFSYVIEEVVQEDPREFYRREHRKRRQKEAEEKRVRDANIFRISYKINLGIFALAVLLVADSWLPTLLRSEVALKEWVSDVRVRGTVYRTRYMMTENRTFAVPSSTGLISYDYSDPKPLAIKLTPLFRVPREVSVMSGDELIVFEPAKTIYSFVIPFHYILLVLSVVAVSLRKHTPFSYSFSVTPGLALVFCGILFLLLA